VVNRHGFHPPKHQLFIAGLFCETKILTELQNQGKNGKILQKNNPKKQLKIKSK
jgi:hypothetical protein